MEPPLEQNLAVLIDFENIAAGTEKENLGRVDVAAIFRRLKVRGRIVVARSYADWGRFARFKQTLLEQGVTMVELTSHGMQDKNRADIALVVDAMELAFTRAYVDAFVIVSGDSDFTPLVLRLKELNKRVIGVGTRGSTSKLLVQATDEFIFYESLLKKEPGEAQAARKARPEKEREKEREREPEAEPTGGDLLDAEQAFTLLGETLEGLSHETEGWVLASVVKSALTRREPSFSESDIGFSSFGRFLEAAHTRGVAAIRRDERSGGYRVEVSGEFAGGAPAPKVAGEPATPAGAGLPALGEEATELRDLLVGEGFDPMCRSARAQIVEMVLALVRERQERRRRTNLHTLRSELVRRVKQARNPVLTANRARAAQRALTAGGVFVHADGKPVRSEGAFFKLKPEDTDGLLDAMDRAYLRALNTLGLDWTPSVEALAELLRDDAAQTRPIEEMLAWLAVETDLPDDAEAPVELEAAEAAPETDPAEPEPNGEPVA